MKKSFLLVEPAVLQRCRLLDASGKLIAMIDELTDDYDFGVDRLSVRVCRQECSPRYHVEYGIPADIIFYLYRGKEMVGRVDGLLYVSHSMKMMTFSRQEEYEGEDALEHLANEMVGQMKG